MIPILKITFNPLVLLEQRGRKLIFVHHNVQSSHNVTQNLIVKKLLFLATNPYFRFFHFYVHTNFLK